MESEISRPLSYNTKCSRGLDAYHTVHHSTQCIIQHANSLLSESAVDECRSCKNNTLVNVNPPQEDHAIYSHVYITDNLTTQGSCQLLLQYLPSYVTADDLRIHFRDIGHLTDIEIIAETASPTARRFCFLSFSTQEAADYALTHPEQIILGHRCVLRAPASHEFLTPTTTNDFRRLYVTGLPSNLAKRHLWHYLERYGQIADLRFCYEAGQENASLRPCNTTISAFVKFVEPSAARDVFNQEFLCYEHTDGRIYVLEPIVSRYQGEANVDDRVLDEE